jgi:molybdopterin converting factor small subunit
LGQLRGFESSIGGVVAGLSEVRAAAGNLNETLGPQFQAVYRTVSEITAMMGSELESMKKHRNELQQMLDGSRGMVAEVHGTMVGLARALSEEADAR